MKYLRNTLSNLTVIRELQAHGVAYFNYKLAKWCHGKAFLNKEFTCGE